MYRFCHWNLWLSKVSLWSIYCRCWNCYADVTGHVSMDSVECFLYRDTIQDQTFNLIFFLIFVPDLLINFLDRMTFIRIVSLRFNPKCIQWFEQKVYKKNFLWCLWNYHIKTIWKNIFTTNCFLLTLKCIYSGNFITTFSINGGNINNINVFRYYNRTRRKCFQYVYAVHRAYAIHFK